MRTRRKFHKKNRLTALTEINVTPLIDLAFALLIIFMIATPLLEQTIPINLPGEVSKPQLDVKNDIQVVSINRQGELYWGSKKVTEAEMTVLLQETSKVDVVPVLRIRADRELHYESVIGLIDLIKQNNLVKISLDTEVK